MVVRDHVPLIGMNKKDVSSRKAFSQREVCPVNRYLIVVVSGGLVTAVGLRHAIAAAADSRWRYVRDIGSVRINTSACMVETIPNHGEVDGQCCRNATVQ